MNAPSTDGCFTFGSILVGAILRNMAISMISNLTTLALASSFMAFTASAQMTLPLLSLPPDGTVSFSSNLCISLDGWEIPYPVNLDQESGPLQRPMHASLR
jgi:hypothetical protein